MEKIDKFNDARKVFDFTYKGIKMNRVLAEDIFLLINQNWKFGKGEIISFFKSYDVGSIKFDNTHHKILSTFGPYPRNDHYESYLQVMDRLDSTVSCNDLRNLKLKMCFHPLTFIIVLCSALPQIFKIKHIPFLQKLFLTASCAKYCNTIDKLNKKKFKSLEKYICMIHILQLENLLTQYFKNLNIPTYSLIEGLYMAWKKNPDDCIVQMLNFETNHLLMWGQYSKDEYISAGFPSDILEVAGYPKKVETMSLKKNNRYQKCMVLLARHSFVSTNMSLLKLLSIYTDKYYFNIKPHPAAIEYYSKVADEYGMKIIPSNETINNCLSQDKYDFCIAVNTSAYYESWMKGIPCLRFNDNSFDIMAGFDDLFSDANEFEKVLNNLKNTDLIELQKKIDNMLKYSIGLGIDRYKDILLS